LSFVMDEKEYRLKVKKLFQELEDAFEDVDPDVLEVEPGLGSLAFLCKRGKTVLSTQPSVSQIWLAAAALGEAVHFNWDEKNQLWMDDRGEGKELKFYLATVFKKIAGLEISF
jgi:iron donor protein CyaY